MSCVNCAARIEKSLNGCDGIGKAAVNFAVEELTVEYDPAVTGRDQIEARVRPSATGFWRASKTVRRI